MKAAFRFLSTLVLLLPLFSPILASANSQPSSESGASGSDIICHGSKCYPRLFVPTMDWQVIEPDQQIPQGLHIRLNMQTGIREGKINVPGEGSEYEAVAVQLPPDGGSDSVVVVGAEEAPEPSTKPSRKPPPPNDDPYGAIKVPVTAQTEELPFTDAVSVILDAKSFSDSKLNDALSSLEGLVHEMYWGLQISTPQNMDALLKLVHTSTNPSIRKSAALVIGSALQNNPKALKSTLDRGTVKDGGKVEVKLMETLVVALQHETDDSARLRIMYAISQSIKSDRTFNDFIRIDGLKTLLELFQKEDTDAGEFKGKISTFVEDNFLDDNMKAETPSKEHHKHHNHHNTQQVLRSTTDPVNPELLVKFSKPFQDTLINSEKLGITGHTVRIKILNALVALQKRYRSDPVNIPLSKDFMQWFGQQISGERNTEKLEEEGEWFKIRALEVKDEVNIP